MHALRVYPSLLNRTVVAALVAAPLAFSSCKLGDDNGKGTLVVPFELGNGKTCKDVGISKVKATLNEDEYTQNGSCSTQEVRFEGVKSGVYTLKLYGISSDGVATMDSAEQENVRVVTDNTVKVDPAVVLVDAPAEIKLRWSLGYGNCQIWKIDHFKVKAWSEDGNKLLLDTKLACAVNKADEDNYRTIPDPDRKLDGSNVGSLQVEPDDSNGAKIGSDTLAKFTFDSPVPGGVVRLSVDCDSDGCTGSGQADE
jgi:hypothetical protein